MSPERRVAWGVLVVGGVSFGVLVAVLVPWQPVPGGPVQPAAPEDYFTAAEIARGEDFGRWARVWGYSSLAVSVLVACVLGFTRLGERLVDRLPGRWWLKVPLAVAALVLLGRVVTLPFAVALRVHVREYGLSRQPWLGFARDLAVSEAIEIAVTSLVLVVLVGLARQLPRAWPAVAGALVAGMVVIGSLVYPMLVEPLFNDFASLPDGPLRSEVLALAERQGVAVDDVLVADASRRTTTLNAYVSGFAGTRRVVLYDNLVDDLGTDQTLSVVAHELAHAKYDDVLVGTGLGAAGAAAGVGALALLMGRRRGVTTPQSVPRVLALLAIAGVVAAPVESGISRQVERRADVVSLETTQDPEALVSLQQDLARRSATDLTPPGLLHWWFGSHPVTLERIGLAERRRAATLVG